MPKRANYRMVDEDDPQWERFWAAYPKRAAKKDARKAWADLNPSPATVDRMLATLEWQVQQPQWTKEGGQYVPYPASWLRAERWTDEAPVAIVKPQAGDAAMSVLETLLGGGDGVRGEEGPGHGDRDTGRIVRRQRGGFQASPYEGV